MARNLNNPRARGEPQRTLFTPAPLPTAVLDDAERLACLRLIRSSNVGPVTFRELINHFGGAKAALAALPGMADRRGARRVRICPEDEAFNELEAARRAGARPIFTIEPGYPAALAIVDAPPPMLYIQGHAKLLNRPALGIVGSRQASAAGIKLAHLFAAELAADGIVIVSGLARGIDAAAHEASLAGGTVAVVAGGSDFYYPPEHTDLQRRIAERGCVVTEQPPGFVPRAKDFPRRNRLVSGISLGVLVIEAAARSGTLITARFAAEQGREVFAVPGHPLDPRAEGTNQLIKSGATLVTNAADVLAVLSPMMGEPRAASGFADVMEISIGSGAPPTVVAPSTSPAAKQSARLPDAETSAAVLAVLGPHPTSLDDITRATGLSAGDVRVALMELDLAGEIERHGHLLVSRISTVTLSPEE